MGDVEVDADDWVVGDVDGVTIVPAASLGEVIAAGRARAKKEDGFFTALREGQTTLELLSLDESPIGGA